MKKEFATLEELGNYFGVKIYQDKSKFKEFIVIIDRKENTHD